MEKQLVNDKVVESIYGGLLQIMEIYYCYRNSKLVYFINQNNGETSLKTKALEKP